MNKPLTEVRALPVLRSAADLRQELDARTEPGLLWHPLEAQRVRCVACAHRCVIGPGSHGACGVRRNVDGALRVPFGYVARRYVRNVETNTVFHVRPGARALTFGMYGCDLRCPYCHNHRISQALRDGGGDEHPTAITAEKLVEEALTAGCSVVCAAYNEPMISAEWTHAVFERARQSGLTTALISDGHSTPEALTYMRDVTDVFRVDLKAATEEGYRKLGGRLAPVLDSIRAASNLGYWVEVVTLVVPGLNQDLGGLRALAQELRSIRADIPWHLNGFVPRYRLAERPATDSLFLVSAAGMAYAAGMQFVYVSNVPTVRELSHTRCPDCQTPVVLRNDYATLESRLNAGRCPSCSSVIAGLW